VLKTEDNGSVSPAPPGRDHISYSEINTFQRCSLQHWYRYVENAPPEQVSAALILGSGVHAAIEGHLQAVLNSETPPTIAELMGVFDDCWKREASEKPVSYPRGQDADEVRATAERMIQRFMESPYAIPQGQVIGIEHAFKASLARDLPPLAGRIDLITWQDDELVITDYKTARSFWNSDTAQQNASQLLLYAEGLKQMADELDARITLQFIILTKAKTPKIASLPVQFAPDQLARTKLTVRRVVDAMKHQAVYPSPSPLNCSICPYQRRCEAWHRISKIGDIPPEPHDS
jgi:putative RecB family exonuclease